MGQRGAPPAPTALKVVRGDRPSRVNEDEPAPDPRAVPGPPTYLSAAARRNWRRLAPDLHRKGILTWWDVDAFARYCEAADAARLATIDINERGILIENGNGDLIKNPSCQVQRDSATIVKVLAREFGLTPSARSAFVVGSRKSGEDDPAAILS